MQPGLWFLSFRYRVLCPDQGSFRKCKCFTARGFTFLCSRAERWGCLADALETKAISHYTPPVKGSWSSAWLLSGYIGRSWSTESRSAFLHQESCGVFCILYRIWLGHVFASVFMNGEVINNLIHNGSVFWKLDHLFVVQLICRKIQWDLEERKGQNIIG